jgi:hypothetical protein
MFLFGLATPIPDLEIVGLAILYEYAITAGVDAPGLAAFAETTYYYADNVTNGGGGGQPSGDSGFNFGENWEPPNKRDIASEEDVADYYDYWSQNDPNKIIDESTTNHFWDNLRKSGLDYQDVVDILKNGKKYTDTRIFSEYKNFLLWDSNKGAYLVIDRINGDIVNIIQSAHVPSGVPQGWFDPTQLYMIPGFPVFDNSENIHWGQ